MKNLTAEFIEAFDASRDPQLWLKLIDEEIKEAQEALAHFLKEIADVRYVMEGLRYVLKDDRLFPEEIGADRFAAVMTLESALSERAGSYMALQAHGRVHASNMSKLGDDGKPIRREDGKILKGPNYREPYLMDLVTPL